MRLCYRVDHIPARAHVVGTGYTRLVTVVVLDMNADNNLFSPRDEIGKHKKINTIPIGEWGGEEKSHFIPNTHSLTPTPGLAPGRARDERNAILLLRILHTHIIY